MLKKVYLLCRELQLQERGILASSILLLGEVEISLRQTRVAPGELPRSDGRDCEEQLPARRLC